MSLLTSDQWYYANTAEGFLADAKKDGYIGDILEAKFKQEWGVEPHLNLLRSWHASPQELAVALEKGRVKRDQIIILEYRIDTHNKADAVICGLSRDEPNAVIVEMKQWNEKHTIRSCNDPEMIEMQFGNAWVRMEHPSIQAKRYRERMKEVLTGSQSTQSRVTAYAYLHNCNLLSDQQLSVLRGEKFGDIFNEIPIYTGIYAKALGNRIREKTRDGNGEETLKILGMI